MKRTHLENKYLYRPIVTPIVWIAVIVTLDVEQVVSIHLAKHFLKFKEKLNLLRAPKYVNLLHTYYIYISCLHKGI